MKKKTLKKRANRLFSSLSISDNGATCTIGKPLRGREIKSLVYAANKLLPFEGFEDLLKYAAFNKSRKYILDLDTNGRLTIIRYCDAGLDGLSYTYLELLDLERRGFRVL